MVRSWRRPTGGKDRRVRYCPHSYFASRWFLGCVGELTHLWCWPKKTIKKSRFLIEGPQNPLSPPFSLARSLSLSLALRLRRGVASLFPEVIISQRTRLNCAHSPTMRGDLRRSGSRSHYLYASKDKRGKKKRKITKWMRLKRNTCSSGVAREALG